MIKRKKFALSFISILCNIKVTVASYYAYSGLTHDQLFLSHDKYCDFFYRLEKCPDGLVFNSKTRVCDLPTKTNCDGRTISNLVLSTTNAPLIVSEDDVRITDTISTEFNNDFPTDIEKSSTEIDEVGKWIYDGAKCYPVKRCPSIDPLDSTIFIPHHSDCSLFCGCKYGSAFLYRCQNGLHFNAKTLKCDFPDRVRCMKGSISQSTTRIIQESVTDTEISRTSTPSAVQGNPQYNQNGVGKWTFEGGKCHPKKRCPLIDSFDHIQFIPHRSNCSLFCGCKEGTALLYSCLPGFFFNPNKSECDFPEIAGCIEEKPIQKSTTGATKSVTESVNLLLSTQNSRIEYHPQYEDGVGKWTYEGGKCLPKKLCPSIDPLDSITFIAHRSNCSLFCGCKNGLPYVYSCLPGFHFNERTSKCDFPYLVGCEQENIDEGNNFVETETDVGSTLSFSSEYSTQENLHVTVSMSTESITDTTSSEISTQSYEVESSSVSENGSRKWTYDGSKCVPIKECPLIDPVASVTFIAHRSNCSQFCGCKDGSAFLYNCLPGLHFNPTFAECDLPNIAGCKSNKYETTVTKPETNTPIYTYTSSSTSAMEVEDAMVPVDGIKIGGKCLPVKRCPSIDFTDTNTFIAHRLHCNYFCECKLGSAILYRCPPGYHFNPNISKCDFPERAACIPRMFPTFTTLNPTTQLIDDIKTTTLANVPKSTNEFQPHSEQLPVEGIEIGGKCLPKRRCPLIDLFDSITFVEHRSDCSIFCRCIEGTAILYHCPTGYHFNPLISKCDLPERANCKGSKISDERTFKPTRVTTTSTSNPNIFPSSTDKVQFRDEVLPVQGIKVGGKCFPRRKCPLIDLLDSITFVAHRSNCNLFCECIDGNAILYRCPTGYHFNPNISKCDLPERASCNAGKIPISRTFIPTTRVTDSTISPSGIPNHTDEFQQYGKFVPVEGIKIGGKCLPIKRCPLIDLFDSIAFIAYRSNCSLFCGCIKGNAVLYRCPTGYHFNPTISKCDLPERADCIEGKRPDFTMLNPTPVAITTTTSSILATVASLNDEFQSNWDLLPVDGIKIGKKCLPKRKCPLIDLFDSITFVAHRSDCSLFCRCIDGTAILYRCPTGYYFNPTISKCDLPKRANCKINDFTTLNQINSVAITTTTSFSLPTIPSPTDGFQSHAEVYRRNYNPLQLSNWIPF
ncbi:chitin-binding domain protein cbd-1-like [Periplaneta americana]|uniref:chitin-binding domain protein cbd-1-like n=1 Tax=Periplaneta americana TaxID=6978 RepID=UPI0037E8F206